MAWHVELTARLLADLDALYIEINATESAGAARWFAKLEDTIALLAVSPHMGKPTHGNPSVREFIYGKKPHLYRVLYACNEANQVAVVLTIQHGRRSLN